MALAGRAATVTMIGATKHDKMDNGRHSRHGPNNIMTTLLATSSKTTGLANTTRRSFIPEGTKEQENLTRSSCGQQH